MYDYNFLANFKMVEDEIQNFVFIKRLCGWANGLSIMYKLIS